ERDQDVADEESRSLRRTTGFDRKHDHRVAGAEAESLSKVIRQTHLLHADTEIAPRHLSTVEQLCDGSLDRRDGQRQGGPSRKSGSVHADDAAGGVDERSPGEPRIDVEIRTDQPVDSSALPRAPLP